MSKKTPIPPVAARKPNVRSAHGQSWNDDWFWLREKENPEVLAYLRAENAYTEEILAPTRALQETIVREIRGRIRERDQSAPTKDGPYRYYTRFEEGAEYPVYCRVPVDGDREEVLLDLAELARGKPYCDIGVFEYSHL